MLGARPKKATDLQRPINTDVCVIEKGETNGDLRIGNAYPVDFRFSEEHQLGIELQFVTAIVAVDYVEPVHDDEPRPKK
jgi:hypothetical protein